MSRLTALFEQAKFSRHEIDSGMKQDAIGALREIRDDLQATRHEAPPSRLIVLFVFASLARVLLAEEPGIGATVLHAYVLVVGGLVMLGSSPRRATRCRASTAPLRRGARGGRAP